MFGSSQTQLIRRPSIQLITDDSFSIPKITNKNSILSYFISPDFQTFDLDIFKGYNNLSAEFQLMVNALKNWNKSIQQNKYANLSKTEQAQYQFIYSTLKRIMKKGEQSRKHQLNSLIKWFYQGKKKQDQPINKKKKFTSYITSQQQIKQKFSYDTVSQLKNYRRKQFGSFDKMTFFTTAYHSPEKDQQKSVQRKSKTDSDYNRFHLNKRSLLQEEKQLRLRRQKSEIQLKKRLYAIRKARVLQQSLQNFYEGKFEKPTQMFYHRDKIQRKTDNSLTKVKFYQLNSTFSDTQISFSRKYTQTPKELSSFDAKNKQNTPNIIGINLIKNPFQNISKLKKKKR